ncbi:hypothetical protein [Actinoplanes sp. NPDC049118]|uniref:hypothetical protein n=1 Tax=Actinoplanes sp. NPDC049118 TaxID=3155769 RepID=UPI003400CAE7
MLVDRQGLGTGVTLLHVTQPVKRVAGKPATKLTQEVGVTADPAGGRRPTAAVSDPVRGPRPWMMVGAPLLAFAAAAGVGTVAGFVIAAVQSPGPSSGWEELGAFVLGLFVGAAVGVVVYVAALTVAARRLFAPGPWAVPVLLTLVAHAAVVAVVAGLTSHLQPTSGGGKVATVLMCLAFGACGPASFVGYGTTGRPRLCAVVVLSALTLSTVLVAGVSAHPR